MISRRSQFHQNRLIEHVTPFDRIYQMFSDQSSQILQYRGFQGPLSDQGVSAVIYRDLLRQASMMSFNEAFYIVSIIMICVLPLVIFMKRGKAAAPARH